MVAVSGRSDETARHGGFGVIISTKRSRAGRQPRHERMGEWMSGTVSLTVVGGPSDGESFAFTERSVTVAGRAEDCWPRIVERGARMLVSRHHCLFDINPPDIRVRDFGSLNGTFVNEVSIGKRDRGQSPEEGARRVFPEQDLRDGDLIKLGETVLRIGIEKPAMRDVPTVMGCASCGAVTESGGRAGELLCEACRAEPDHLLDDMLEDAAAGDPTLMGIAEYQVIRELGRGGQGRVYLVRDRKTKQVEAMKLLLAEVAVEPKRRQEFLREIENIQALHHRNIVGFRQAGFSNGAFYLTTEFCDGGSVVDLMKERGEPLPVREAVPIIVQALDGLEYAHTVFLGADARGLVHRDIKPANILLSGSGDSRVAKLGDFGLAKAFDRAGLSGQSMTGTIAGTVSFMSRKQLINYKYAKPDVDVWSMAATLYWMLTLCTPRVTPPGGDPIRAVLDEVAVPIREREPTVPKRLAEVIDAALIEKPPSAINTAAKFADALRSAM